MSTSPKMANFLVTNRALVLLYFAEHPGATYKACSKAIGITERQVMKLTVELEAAALLTRRIQGRVSHKRTTAAPGFIEALRVLVVV